MCLGRVLIIDRPHFVEPPVRFTVESSIEGCAPIRHDSWLRPTGFAAPEPLFSAVALLFQRSFRREQDC